MIPQSTLLNAGFYSVPPGHVAAVVTILERNAGTPQRPTERDDVTLEPVLKPEQNWYRTLFTKIGAPWLWASRLEWDAQKLQDKISAPTTRLFVAKANGEEIGYAELDFYAAGKCEIAFLGLLTQYSGQGIGRWLLQNAIFEAESARAKHLMIHTCTLDDARALALYMKCGFKPVRRAVEIMPDPRIKGLLPLDVSAHPLF